MCIPFWLTILGEGRCYWHVGHRLGYVSSSSKSYVILQAFSREGSPGIVQVKRERLSSEHSNVCRDPALGLDWGFLHSAVFSHFPTWGHKAVRCCSLHISEFMKFIAISDSNGSPVLMPVHQREMGQEPRVLCFLTPSSCILTLNDYCGTTISHRCYCSLSLNRSVISFKVSVLRLLMGLLVISSRFMQFPMNAINMGVDR